MGSFFSNIHIRRNGTVSEETVVRSIERMMQRQNYQRVLAAADADTAVILVNSESSAWFSVYSDLFEFEDDGDFARLAAPVSGELNTDMLNIGCFDSDYLYMNLINTPEQVDAWASVGEDEGTDDVRHGEFSVWESKVQNFRLFKESLCGEYVFAEDVLAEMEECLCLPRAYSAASYEDFEEMEPDAAVQYLYFRMKADPPQREKPRLSLWISPSVPCFLESRSSISVLNEGGVSRGLSVFFVGSYVEHDEITFSDVEFVLGDDDGIMLGRVPFELKKERLSDGRWVYYHHAPELVIPEKINEQLPIGQQEKLRYKKRIGVCFTPHGNKRKILDITVVLVPDENNAGQVGWNVWHGFDSKAEYIKAYNERFVSFAHEPLRAEDFD